MADRRITPTSRLGPASSRLAVPEAFAGAPSAAVLDHMLAERRATASEAERDGAARTEWEALPSWRRGAEALAGETDHPALFAAVDGLIEEED